MFSFSLWTAHYQPNQLSTEFFNSGNTSQSTDSPHQSTWSKWFFDFTSDHPHSFLTYLVFFILNLLSSELPHSNQSNQSNPVNFLTSVRQLKSHRFSAFKIVRPPLPTLFVVQQSSKDGLKKQPTRSANRKAKSELFRLRLSRHLPYGRRMLLPRIPTSNLWTPNFGCIGRCVGSGRISVQFKPRWVSLKKFRSSTPFLLAISFFAEESVLKQFRNQTAIRLKSYELMLDGDNSSLIRLN